jgi:peptide/nickel transport system permease protein
MSRPPPTDPIARVFDILWHLAGPMTVLTIISFGGFTLIMRASLLEVMTEDYIVTARAKGLDEHTVVFKHAMRNALLPIVTVVALSFGFILSGAIITETIFSWHGLGAWSYDAVSRRDYPVLQALFFIISLCVVIANFIADIVYGFLDPRIKR